MKQLNLALKLLLELGALIALGLWGASAADGAAAVLLAFGLPLLAAALWAMLAAPKARRRLSLPLRAPFELGVFAVGALALRATGAGPLAAMFAALILLNAILLTAFDQWEA